MIGFIDSKSFKIDGFDLLKSKELDYNDPAFYCFDFNNIKHISLKDELYKVEESLFIFINEGSVTFDVGSQKVMTEQGEILIIHPNTCLRYESGYANVSAFTCPLKFYPQETSFFYKGRNCTIECTIQTLSFNNYQTRQHAVDVLRDIFDDLSYLFSFQYLRTENRIVFPDKKSSRFALSELVKRNRDYENYLDEQITQTFISFTGIDLSSTFVDSESIKEVNLWVKQGDKDDFLEKSHANIMLF